MDIADTVIAVYANHLAAEEAVKKLSAAGFEMKSLSVVGKGYHTEEKVVGFYNIGDRVSFWGGRGAFWGGLWGLFFGGLFIATPLVGPIIVLGFLTTAVIAVLEGAAVVGGLSALGAAVYSLGVPKDSVIHYETALKADSFLVFARGDSGQIARARMILDATAPSQIDIHSSKPVEDSLGQGVG